MKKFAAEESQLITVRIPKEDADALRVFHDVTGVSMSENIRRGMMLRNQQLQADPEVRQAVVEHIAKLQAFLDYPVQIEG